MNLMRYQMTCQEGTAIRLLHLFKNYNRISRLPHNRSLTQIIRRPRLRSQELILSVVANVSRSASAAQLQSMDRPMHRSRRLVAMRFAAPAVTSESCASLITLGGPITLTTFSCGTSILRSTGCAKVSSLRPAMLATPVNVNSFPSTTTVNGSISYLTCAGIAVVTDATMVKLQ